jgi:hypothetical protein
MLSFWLYAIVFSPRLSAGQIATYDQTKRLLIDRAGLPDRADTHTLASFVASLITVHYSLGDLKPICLYVDDLLRFLLPQVTVTNPHDVVKTRLMNQRRLAAPANSNTSNSMVCQFFNAWIVYEYIPFSDCEVSSKMPKFA